MEAINFDRISPVLKQSVISLRVKDDFIEQSGVAKRLIEGLPCLQQYSGSNLYRSLLNGLVKKTGLYVFGEIDYDPIAIRMILKDTFHFRTSTELNQDYVDFKGTGYCEIKYNVRYPDHVIYDHDL